MYQLDEEPIETMHVYVYKKEPSQPAWWNRDRLANLLIGLMALAGIISLCFIPNEPVYAIQTVSVPAHFLPPQIFTVNSLVIPTGQKTYPATYARGALTIYNGSILAQELPAGFIATSGSGVEVVTDNLVTIPPANPPSYGIATVSAHALQLGKTGNIDAYEVNAVYGADLYLKNLTAFTGGRDSKVVAVVTDQDTQLSLTNARSTLVGQRNRYPGLLAYPCQEHLAQKDLALMVSWDCQFVSFTPPPRAKVLSARVAGNVVLLQVSVAIAAYPKGLPGKWQAAEEGTPIHIFYSAPTEKVERI